MPAVVAGGGGLRLSLRLSPVRGDDLGLLPRYEDARGSSLGFDGGGGAESSAMTMEWALMELLRRLDAAVVATEELYRVVSPTGGGELGG
ncbi:hypothetical protein QYE76_035654 [Lolium multiflorum]|uniref:Uncharacterized protein n=1 Tax=Lolium multiflorum TaxID=4521 RepID=A0AAD8R1B0_LOLMU|nr:hypothetical protein QYE76_035654 [Lolium multiflorum]